LSTIDFIATIKLRFKLFLSDSKTLEFDNKITQIRYEFNNDFFHRQKYRLRIGEIDEEEYGRKKEQEISEIYQDKGAYAEVKIGMVMLQREKFMSLSNTRQCLTKTE
jgi:hypothetical protein